MDVLSNQGDLGKAWGLENPVYGEEKVSLWHMPSIRNLLQRHQAYTADFDQCMFGLGTAKHSRFAFHGLTVWMECAAITQCETRLITKAALTGQRIR